MKHKSPRDVSEDIELSGEGQTAAGWLTIIKRKEQSPSPLKNPPHPGHSIKNACLEPLLLSVTEGAKVLGVTRHTLSRVINGQSGISAEMAIRLEKAGWSNAEFWLRLQASYDLAQARKRQDQIKVERYRRQSAA